MDSVKLKSYFVYIYDSENNCNLKKYGFCDEDGKMQIYPKYESAKKFSEGLGAVCINWKWGFINAIEKTIVEFKYSSVEPFHDGFARVQKLIKHGESENYYWGVINKQGEEVIPFIYKSLTNFDNGVALAQISYGQYKFIKEDGRNLFDDSFYYAEPFVGDFAKVGKMDETNYSHKLKYGIEIRVAFTLNL
jgi:hypothetical protein